MLKYVWVCFWRNKLKIGVSLLISAIGFLTGVLLAGGAEILSARSLYQIDQMYDELTQWQNPKSLETYWQETGIGIKEVRQLISNKKCSTSVLYFKACLNSVIEKSLTDGLQISELGELISLKKEDNLIEKNQKQLLQHYSEMLKNEKLDFEKLTLQLFENASESKRPATAAEIINSFYSVYFDPHTYILPSSYYSEVGSKISRSKYFVGISYKRKNGDFYIDKIFKNSDAEISGLKVNDKILEINSVPMSFKNYSDVSSFLRAEDQDIIDFKVERGNQTKRIILKRSYRVVKHAQYEQLSDQIGMVILSKFSAGACYEVSNFLKTVQQQNLNNLILDLRGNPGGQLNEAACLAGLFLGPNKTIYYVDYFNQKQSNEVVLTSDEQQFSGNLVVLLNSESASASELLAGTLQEQRRAVVIGEKSFGKGSFQEDESWILNSKINLYKTQGLYLLPSLKSTQLVGVQPDLEVQTSLAPERERDLFAKPIPNLKLVNSFLNPKKYISKKVKTCLTENEKKYKSEDLILNKGMMFLNCLDREKNYLAQTSKGD